MSSILHILGNETPIVLTRMGRLHHVGPAHDPHVRCLFFREEPEDRRHGGFEISLPLGQLADLRLGDVVHPDGRVTPYRTSQVFSAKARIDDAPARASDRASLIHDGVLPLFGVDSRGDDPAGTSSSRWLVIPTPTGPADMVVIPALLLFSTYFAPNSRLALSYFQGTILDTLEELESSDASTRGEDGKCGLRLGRGFLVSDAIPLARAIFDPDGKAWNEAAALSSRIEAATRQGREYVFDCSFPFTGDTELTYRAVEYRSRDNERVHCLLDIHECRFPLPWTQLHVSMDQTKRVSGGGTAGSVPSGSFVDDFTDDFTRLNPDDPSEPGLAAVLRARQGTSFPVPGQVTVSRREVESTAPSGKLGKKRHGFSAKLPSGQPGSGNQYSHVAPPLSAGTEPAVDEPEVLSPVCALESVSDSINDLRELDGFKVAALHIFPTLTQYAGLVLNEVPAFESNGKPGWPPIKGGKQPRCFLILSLNRADRTIYLLEVLRNPRESISTLLLFSRDLHELPAPELEKFFGMIARNGSMPSTSVLDTCIAATTRRVRHPSPSASTEAWSLLRRTVCDLFNGVSTAAAGSDQERWGSGAVVW